LGKGFLAVRTEKHKSNLDKKVVEFSSQKGFCLRLDRQMIVREGSGVCELSSVTTLFSKAEKNVS